jgi:phage N-6-adenine-methyltransferase
MNTSFEKNSKNTTDEWYTPKSIIDALGQFDLDPCAPEYPLFDTAKTMYNKNDNGLSKEWFGRVWLNPPYSRPLIEQFVKKMADHGNGIALLFNRCDNKMFHDIIFEKATAIKFLRKRIRFLRPDGSPGDSPGCGSVLIAFGKDNANILKQCNIQGKYLILND